MLIAKFMLTMTMTITMTMLFMVEAGPVQKAVVDPETRVAIQIPEKVVKELLSHSR